MKKYLIVLLALSMVMAFGFGVLAQEDPEVELTWAETYWEDYGYGDGNYDDFQDQGTVVWVNEWDPDQVYLPFDRDDYTPDKNGGGSKWNDSLDADQVLAIKVPTEAYIPCYLELTLVGNQGMTSVGSYGPDSAGEVITGDASEDQGYGILFDNEIGGYIDEDWNFLARGSNVNTDALDTEGEVYIGACDIMKVMASGNEAFRYEVYGGALVKVDGNDNNGNLLPIDMRTSFDLGDTWSMEHTFAGAAETKDLGDFEAGTSLEALHYFRVPANGGTHHGHYSGFLTFRVVSI